jgi:hypothetical protein
MIFAAWCNEVFLMSQPQRVQSAQREAGWSVRAADVFSWDPV